MKLFLIYLKEFLRNSTLKNLIFTILFVGLLTVLNYRYGIERRIRDIHPWYLSLMSFFFFYGFVLFFCWGLQYSFGRRRRRSPGAERHGTGKADGPQPGGRRRLLLLILVAPLFFAFKMIHWDLSVLFPAAWKAPWDAYAQIVLQLPAKLLLLCMVLWGCKKMQEEQGGGEAGWMGGIGRPGGAGGMPAEKGWVQAASGWLSYYGLTTKNFQARPYFGVLLLLVPLIALASTRPDFLHTYPKVQRIAFLCDVARPLWPWQLLYELSYGLDFLNIELFFRGFLVIGLARYAGANAILPMAAFYCTIHFGKPLGECISSFFGGLMLGVIALRTRSIVGGLIVHLGLAWMMEIGGWIGNSL